MTLGFFLSRENKDGSFDVEIVKEAPVVAAPVVEAPVTKPAQLTLIEEAVLRFTKQGMGIQAIARRVKSDVASVSLILDANRN